MANEELPTNSEQVPSLEIPDLKKKEKERKKAGAALGKGGQAGEAFQGARGGAGLGGGAGGGAGGAAGGVARAAASAAARGLGQAGLEAGGSLFSRIAAMVARFLATAIGKAVAAVVVAAMLAGVAAVARMAGGAGADPAAGAAALGDISSSIRVRRDGDASGLGMARNNGLVQFDKAKQAAPPDAGKGPDGAGAPPDKGAVAGDAAGANGGAGGPGGLDNGAMMAAQRDRLAHNMSMSKLSSSLGQGGSFGGKDIFSNGPKLGRGFNAGKLAANAKPPVNKGAASSRAKVSSRAAQRRGAFRGSRALGRLMQMATLNRGMTAGTATSEGASTMASDQFEGQNTSGGAAPTGAPTSTDSGTSGGGTSGGGTGTGGGPNIDQPPLDACTELGKISDGNGGCYDPSIGPGIDGTPWANVLASAFKMMSIAKTLLLISSILYSIGMALVATCCGWIGAIILGIVAMIMTIITTVLAMVIKDMGGMITDMGQQGLGDTVKDIGGDLLTGAWTAVIGGIGGFWFWNQVENKMDTLSDQMGQVMSNYSSGLGGGTGGAGTGGTGGGGGGAGGGGQP